MDGFFPAEVSGLPGLGLGVRGSGGISGKSLDLWGLNLLTSKTVTIVAAILWG